MGPGCVSTGGRVEHSEPVLSLAASSLVLPCFSLIFPAPQVPVVLAGHPGEFVCLVVVSDHRLYVLKVTGDIR